MLKLSEEEIVRRIKAGEQFECSAEDDSFTLKIEQYVPFICTAIHDGHQFRPELEKICQLNEAERLYEEDPYTGELISSLPITLIGCDSRYEYDLNRPVAQCVYKKAWGKTVWTKGPSAKQLQISYEKHRCFYRVLDALIKQIEKRFGACQVFDIHSYNYKRIEREVPTFNLGIEQIDMERWARVVNRFDKQLTDIVLPNMEVSTGFNAVFYGRGYLIAHVNSRFENTLVVPTEVKKIFMDELSGQPFPLVLNDLKDGFKRVIVDTAAYFTRTHTRKKRAQREDMLSTTLEPVVLKVDAALYRLVKGMETLSYINPINIQHEQKRFFAQRGNHQPDFKYRQLNIDPYLLRQKLYRLPVGDIRDAGIQQMYRQVIDATSEKIDLLVSSGSESFVYNSLRYYGEPSKQDLENARYLMYAPDLDESAHDRTYNVDEMIPFFRAKAKEWGMDCRVESSTRLVAAAMVNNSKRSLVVRSDAMVDELELNALAHHELGVHMATSLNSLKQPLKVFALGLPGNTMTQEGLAILNEYLSGNLNLARLRNLALRVLAVDQMLQYGDFRHTWVYLVEEHNMPQNEAFRLATRVHRGGGFTKDYLYLRGLCSALKLYRERDISGLFIGKTGFAYLPIINEMIERGILDKPTFLPEFLKKPQPGSEVMEYLLSSIRPTLDSHLQLGSSLS